jgi:hypothetical protein
MTATKMMLRVAIVNARIRRLNAMGFNLYCIQLKGVHILIFLFYPYKYLLRIAFKYKMSRFIFLFIYLTVNTGQLASLTTSEVTLPSTRLLSLDLPLGPTTIKSICLSFA